MKKFLMLLVITLAAPLFAATSVSVTVQDKGSGWAAINYAVTEANVVAFGLNVSVDSSAKITAIQGYFTGECNSTTKGYGIFPGRIGIAGDGTVTSWGNPIAPNTAPGASSTGLGTGTVVLELGALYDNIANKPGATGQLCQLKVDKCCKMSIAVNGTRCGKTTGGADGGVVINTSGVVSALVPTMDTSKQINYNCTLTCATCLGDSSGNKVVNTSDLSNIITLLNKYSAAATPFTCFSSNSDYKPCADATKNNRINVSDISKIVGWLNVYSASTPPYSVPCSAKTWPE